MNIDRGRQTMWFNGITPWHIAVEIRMTLVLIFRTVQGQMQISQSKIHNYIVSYVIENSDICHNLQDIFNRYMHDLDL